MENVSRLGRMPVWAFTLLCVLVSGTGLVVFSIVGAAISDIAHVSNSVIVVCALVGLIGPTAWLIWARRKQWRPANVSSTPIGNASPNTPLESNPTGLWSKIVARLTPRIILTGALIGAGYFVLTNFVLPSRDTLGVKVTLEEEGALKGVTIINVKSAPLKILRAKINDRSDCLLNPPVPDREMKEGDQALLITACAVLRVTLDTSRGTATYTFK